MGAQPQRDVAGLHRFPYHPYEVVSQPVEVRFQSRSRMASAVDARETVHIDQASRAAVRRLIPPTPLPCSLAPTVTTPLYSMIAR
jgi:hypothetical protein